MSASVMDDDARLVAETASRFLADRYAFTARTKRVAAGRVDPAMWRAFAEMGWLALPVPVSAGGLGASHDALGALMEAFGRALVVEPYVACIVQGASLLAAADRTPLMSSIVAGERRVTVAMLEPDGVPDLRDLATTATPLNGGGWRLSGRKHFVIDGDGADDVIVPARTASGPALFVVSRMTPGLTPTGYRTIDGARAADVELSDVLVDDTARLALDDPTAAFDDALDLANAALVAEAVGCMRAAYELTVDYVKTRVQFGQPIGRFQVVRHRIADMFMAVEESRAMAAEALAALALDDAVDRSRAVAAAKVHVVDRGRFVGQQAIQLHGAIGLTEEYVVGHYYERIEAIANDCGDADWQLDRYVALGAQGAST